MQKMPVIGKDLHHPYSVLVIFMVMMVFSAYTHKAEESLIEQYSTISVTDESVQSSSGNERH